MAMATNGMGDAIIAAINGLTLNQTTDATTAEGYQQELWRAIGNAITTYIQAHAEATGTDSRGDTHDLSIT